MAASERPSRLGAPLCTPPCTRTRLRTPLWRRRGGVRGLEDRTKTPLWGQVSSPLWAESTVATATHLILSSALQSQTAKRFSGVFFFFFSAFWAPAPPPLAAPPGGTGGASGISPSSIFLSSPLCLCFHPSIHPASSTRLVPSPPSPSPRVLNPLSSLSVQPVCPSFLVCFPSSPPRPG